MRIRNSRELGAVLDSAFSSPEKGLEELRALRDYAARQAKFSMMLLIPSLVFLAFDITAMAILPGPWVNWAVIAVAQALSSRKFLELTLMWKARAEHSQMCAIKCETIIEMIARTASREEGDQRPAE